MSSLNTRDYLYLIWKDYKTRQKYIIGELSKNGKYEFKYRINDVDNAIKNGFEPLIAFANINEVYESYDMFPAFSSRLPDKRRKDVKEILAKYELEKYDAFELLKKSGETFNQKPKLLTIIEILFSVVFTLRNRKKFSAYGRIFFNGCVIIIVNKVS